MKKIYQGEDIQSNFFLRKRGKAILALIFYSLGPFFFLRGQAPHHQAEAAWNALAQGDYAQAIQQAEAVLQATDTSRFPLLTADLLSIQGNARRHLGQPEQAVQVHLRVLRLRERALGRQSQEAANTLINLGNCYLDLRRLPAAEGVLKKAAAILPALSPADPVPQAHLSNSLGYLAHLQKRYDKARESYLRALQLYEGRYGKESPQTGKYLYNLARLSIDQGRLAELRLYLGRLKNLAPEDPGIRLMYLQLHAQERQLSGDYWQALQINRQAQQHMGSLPGISLKDRLTLFMESAEIQMQLGDYEGAVSEYKQAWALLGQFPVELWFEKAAIHNGWGSCLQQLGDFEPAIAQYEAAIGLLLSHRLAGLSEIFFNLAVCFWQAGDAGLSRYYLQKAIQDSSEKETLASAELLQGKLYLQESAYALASQHFSKARRLLEGSLPFGARLICASWIFSAEAFIKLKDFEGAKSCLREAALLFPDFPEAQRAMVWPQEQLALHIAMAALALAEAGHSGDRADWKTAYDVCQKAIDYVGAYHFQLEGRGSILAGNIQTRPVFSGIAEACFALGSADPNFIEKAFSFCEMSKAFLQRRLIWESRAKKYAGIPEALLEKEKALAARLRTATPDSGVAGVQGELQALRAKLRSEYPAFYRMKFGMTSPSAADIRSMLSPDQALVAYFLDLPRVYIFAMNRDTFIGLQKQLDAPLYQSLETYWGLLANPGFQEQDLKRVVATGRRLYLDLLDPVADLLRERVLIIPDGKLHYLPFEVLLTGAPADLFQFQTYPYFLQRHAVTYVSGAGLIHTGRQSSRVRTRRLVALAPTFGRGPADFSPLPHTEEEVRHAARQFRLWRKDILLDQSASVARFWQLAPEAEVIHLATHGITDDQFSDRSYLAFAWRGDPPSREVLSAGEIYAHSLRANLVFLSACQTGLGPLYAGEGMQSLSTAFAYAGANSLISTLWSIPDNQTSALVAAFYKRLRAGASKDVALQQAKLAYLSSARGRAAHPGYWAAFLLNGDAAPLPASFSALFYGLPVLLLLAAGYLFWRKRG